MGQKHAKNSDSSLGRGGLLSNLCYSNKNKNNKRDLTLIANRIKMSRTHRRDMSTDIDTYD